MTEKIAECQDCCLNDPAVRKETPRENTKCAPRPSLLRARPQHLSRQVARMTALFVEHVAVDDRVLDALRRHHEAAAAAGQIVLHARALGRSDFALVENWNAGWTADLGGSGALNSK